MIFHDHSDTFMRLSIDATMYFLRKVDLQVHVIIKNLTSDEFINDA